jgi:hypothetical protein
VNHGISKNVMEGMVEGVKGFHEEKRMKWKWNIIQGTRRRTWLALAILSFRRQKQQTGGTFSHGSRRSRFWRISRSLQVILFSYLFSSF